MGKFPAQTDAMPVAKTKKKAKPAGAFPGAKPAFGKKAAAPDPVGATMAQGFAKMPWKG